MAVTAVVGAQWGDEGKGRIVDLLATEADVVVRFQGGSNAGHTVVNEHGTFALHLVPSGIFNPRAWNIISAGCAVHPGDLLEEMDKLAAANVDLQRLLISERAQVVMPYHQVLDGLDEARRSAAGSQIGTTKKGIGPCYTDKAARIGLQVGDLLERDWLQRRVGELVALKNEVITGIYGGEPLDADAVFDRLWEQGCRLKAHIGDTLETLHGAIDRGARVLLEGQLGALRDLDWGTYPYVTSSSPTSGGAAAGAGIPPRCIEQVVGVAKAYTTAVGTGPFPSELSGDAAGRLREIGAEYGATTGRPRRCGWFDVVAVRHAAKLNGFTSLALTKLDVLDSFESIDVCTAYRLDGETLHRVPLTRQLERVETICETLPGWQAPTTACRHFQDLPLNAQRYVVRLEELCGVPIKRVSVGAERSEIVIRD